jgi:hypothetical protein
MARKSDTEEGRTASRKTAVFVAWTIFVGVLVVVGSVYLGKSDNGQIDVAATIGQSNQAIVDGGGDQSGLVDVVPQTFQDMPNGGLVAQESNGEQAEPEPVVDTGSTTPPVDGATTTEVSGEAESTTENTEVGSGE